MKNILDRLIDDFHERDLPTPVPREQTTMAVPGKANAVIGMRRAGKTWFCYHYMQELIEKGVDKERFLYINFEDDRLLPFSGTDFQEILDTYYRKFPAFKNQRCHQTARRNLRPSSDAGVGCKARYNCHLAGRGTVP